MARSFDYSKWDNIELSDDESDLHPNIDKESWFRLKHRSRLEREEREDEEVKGLNQKTKEDKARISIIEARLKAANSAQASGDDDNDAQYEDLDALQIELNELKGQIAIREKRIGDIQERRKWNIDNICKTKEEKTIVNKLQANSLKAEVSIDDEVPTAEEEAAVAAVTASAASSAPSSSTATASATPATKPAATPATSTVAAKPKGAEPAGAIKRERMAVINYNDFAIKHEAILEKYSEIHDLEATKDYLYRNCDILMHEHAQSYMLLSCLEDEMNGKHQRMKLVGRQSQILSHIHELGKSMNRDPRDVILPFFKRIQEAEYLTGFISAVDDFIKKIQKRAVEKRKEMDAERASEGTEYFDEDSVPLGPGGLNPLVVLRSLPESLREAFESQDMGRLQQVLGRMDVVEAKHWMKQCVDSGLWVSKDPTAFSDSAADEEAEEEDSAPQESTAEN